VSDAQSFGIYTLDAAFAGFIRRCEAQSHYRRVLVCTTLALVWQEQELKAMNGILVKYSAECIWIHGPLGVPTRPFSFNAGHGLLSLINSSFD
jgi:hypothetical protein